MMVRLLYLAINKFLLIPASSRFPPRVFATPRACTDAPPSLTRLVLATTTTTLFGSLPSDALRAVKMSVVAANRLYVVGAHCCRMVGVSYLHALADEVDCLDRHLVIYRQDGQVFERGDAPVHFLHFIQAVVGDEEIEHFVDYQAACGGILLPVFYPFKQGGAVHAFLAWLCISVDEDIGIKEHATIPRASSFRIRPSSFSCPCRRALSSQPEAHGNRIASRLPS